jgi:hypothetical protein
MMGYRSDVAYKIWFDTEDNLDAFIGMVLASDNELLAKALGECEIGFEECYDGLRPVISFEAESVKWYDDAPDAVMHHKLLCFAAEVFGDENCGARFIRMGENDDDVSFEDMGNDSFIVFDSLYVQRTLECSRTEKSITIDEWRAKKTLAVTQTS